MRFHYSRHRLRGRDKTLERIFEILPGLLSWSILIGMSLLAFKKPLIAAVIIIAFYLYWLLRLFYMNIFLMLSYLKLSAERNTDWIKRIKHLEEEPTVKIDETTPKYEDIMHLVIIPIATESQDIFEPSIASLSQAKFPSDKIIVIIALEDRATEEIKHAVEKVMKKYKDKFNDLLVALHPSGVHGEACVKGANTTHAARVAAKYLQEKGIKFKNVIASCFDSDTVVSADYFSCLTYHYMVTPDRLHSSFQPIPVYHNNIWQAPGFARVLDVGSSFFQLIESTNPEKLVTFSSHSMSFKALSDMDYWPVDMISDDSAIYWKAFLHFRGKYHVVPMYVTVSMDVTESETWVKTAVNVYKQKRRWAWGVENFPIVMRGFIKSKDISLWRKATLTLKLLEGHISWATWPFLLSIIGWLPAIFATRQYTDSMFYYSGPRIAGTIFTLASFGLLVCILVSLFLLPKRKTKHNIIRRIGHAFEWLLVPPITVFFSGLPALDAQTRLMLGKYMEFWITEKKRK
jgi:cellulose synthase/poly-beta-1,6-N-acetylglucosamine synthase-like glycosyltransferase